MKRAYQNEHGFTLIELIVTIAIMAILLFIAVPAFVEYLPDMTKMMCQKNSEIIMSKYDYAISNYNRRKHTDIYADGIESELRDKELKSIKDSVLTDSSTTIHCPSDGNYEIFDKITIAGHVKRVNCTVHDRDSRTAEEIMIDKILVDIHKDIELCKNGQFYDQACLTNKLGEGIFSDTNKNGKIENFEIYKDEVIGKYLFNSSDYNQNWPVIEKEIFAGVEWLGPNVDSQLYIRPKYLSDDKTVLLFASNNNTYGNWSNARAIYWTDTKQWYKVDETGISYDGNGAHIAPGHVSITKYTTAQKVMDDIKSGILIPIEQKYTKKP